MAKIQDTNPCVIAVTSLFTTTPQRDGIWSEPNRHKTGKSLSILSRYLTDPTTLLCSLNTWRWAGWVLLDGMIHVFQDVLFKVFASIHTFQVLPKLLEKVTPVLIPGISNFNCLVRISTPLVLHGVRRFSCILQHADSKFKGQLLFLLGVVCSISCLCSQGKTRDTTRA